MVPQQFLREEVYIAGNVKFEVRVDLADDAWVDGLADGTDAGDALAAALLSGFVSAQSEAAGWNAIVRAAPTNASAEGVALRHGVAGRRARGAPTSASSSTSATLATTRSRRPRRSRSSSRDRAALGRADPRRQRPLQRAVCRLAVARHGDAVGNLLLDPYERDSVGRGRVAPHRPRRRHVAARSRLRGHDGDRRRVHGDAHLGAARRGRRRVGLADGGAGGRCARALSQVIVRESESVLRIELPQLLVYKLYAVETITASVPGACPHLRQADAAGADRRHPVLGETPSRGGARTSRDAAAGGARDDGAVEGGVVDGHAARRRVCRRRGRLCAEVHLGLAQGRARRLGRRRDGVELRANPTQYIEIREVDAGYDIEVDIPASAGYSISEPETISVVIPGSPV